MPMPHRTQMQLIKRRLVGKEGSERTRELRAILAELPNYKNGPYADIRKWVNSQIVGTACARPRPQPRLDRRAPGGRGADRARRPAERGQVVAAAGALSIQIKTGDYAFTTTRPVPALTRIGGVLVQFVEIPGLIEGANEDRGGGRALLGVLRGADAIVYCHACGSPLDELATVRAEVAAAGIEKPSILAATKADDGEPPAQPDLDVVPVSVLDDERSTASAPPSGG